MDFSHALREHGLAPLRRARTAWLQVNLGKRCNQACRHCHVDASPTRTEMMDGETIDRVLAVLEADPALELLDITGGAPELSPHFRRLVRGARGLGRRVLDRCNLTILSEPGQQDLAGFLAEQGVEVVASLPCYSEGNVDAQRGHGVFMRSVEGLRVLNALGYGTERVLSLVYNPGGASLPPAQPGLERDYRVRLREDFGVGFTNLLTLTNMPIARFASDLSRQGRHQEYMELLLGAFNPATVPGLMCRHLISVGWDGQLYDCDFNAMLDLPVGHIRDLETATLEGRGIRVGAHCFGCTAGAGSSCGGALA